jgi:hypothetical protein
MRDFSGAWRGSRITHHVLRFTLHSFKTANHPLLTSRRTCFSLLLA